MSDLEDLLTRELGAVADGAPAARVDLGGVRRVGRRERLRRRATVLAATAALVAGAGAAVVGGGDRSAVPVAAYDLPTGAPLALVWSSTDETVHLGESTVRVPNLRQGETQGGTTVLATQVDDGPTLWSRLVSTGGALTLDPLGPVQESPSVSYDGRWVAWVVPSATSATSGARPRRQQVTRLDVTTGRQDVTELEAVGDGAGPAIGTIDDRGRAVVAVPGGGQLLWVPGADPVPVTGLPEETAAVSLASYGLALVAEDHISATPPTVWRVADDGTAARVGPIAGVSRDVGGIAPDGQHYVTVLGDDELAFAELLPDGTSTVGSPLPLPSATGWSQFGWESATDMVFARSGTHGLDLLRCSVTTDECEQVPDKVWSGFGYE